MGDPGSSFVVSNTVLQVTYSGFFVVIRTDERFPSPGTGLSCALLPTSFPRIETGGERKTGNDGGD